MEIGTPNRETLRQYLLGQLPEADLSQIEERLMSDSNVYEELSILENELIDHYVRGQMSAIDRTRFEHYLRSNQIQQKVRFARAFTRYVDAADQEVMISTPLVAHPSVTPPEDGLSRSRSKQRSFPFWPFQKPAYTYAFVAVLLVIVAGLAWVTIQSLGPAGRGRVFEATLVPGDVLREGGETQTISIGQGSDIVRLKLILSDNQSQDYQVNVLASDGSSVLLRDQLISKEDTGRKSLSVDIPAKTLKPDTYRIKLGGRTSGPYEELASYTFRVK